MLAQYLRRRVSVITTDGRSLVGVLHAADQLLNLVLTSCVERVFERENDDNNNNNNDNRKEEEEEEEKEKEAPMRELSMGVMMIRGSDVVCVMAVNTIEEAKWSVSALRGRNLPPVEEVPRAALAAAAGGN
ncbi:U6 snRNA-associated Sm-like protein LSm8 [Trypanosoma theileri]|uniref:U6 snRNA-associated Sm-like protein LSm8 n=1 Tax=Trypanosoma theileri TaxID=67003 RepID=A0A1X0NYL8_9TRYP|nr:U6 snRNA-associated Sm-like protein LSm8 [Trypanosoma theileri]ORC89648.1 U6 snRNA-associated Sm-like protein LSm8 [Trypanosoma theileri]